MKGMFILISLPGVVVLCVALMCKTTHQSREISYILCVGNWVIYRGSIRKVVKRGES